MDIKTALGYMSVEKAVELESHRFFCNADETVNAISIYSMKKQIPMAVKLMPESLGNERHWWRCPNCNANHHTNTRHQYCHICGQRIDWSEYLKGINTTCDLSELIEKASMSFPEIL